MNKSGESKKVTQKLIKLDLDIEQQIQSIVNNYKIENLADFDASQSQGLYQQIGQTQDLFRKITEMPAKVAVRDLCQETHNKMEGF